MADFRQKLIDYYINRRIDDDVEEIEDFTSDEEEQCVARLNKCVYDCKRHSKKQKYLAPSSQHIELEEGREEYYDFEKMSNQEFIDMGLCYQTDLDFIRDSCRP